MGRFEMWVYIPYFLVILEKIFREQNFHLLKCFNTSFLKEFLEPKDLSLFCLKGWKNQEKEKSLGLVFDLHFISILEVFLRVFL